MDTLLLNKDGQPVYTHPLSILTWQDAFRLITLGHARVLKNYDDWSIRTPSTEYQVPSIIIANSYIKVPHDVQFSRYNVYLRDLFTCQLCHKKFMFNQLTFDHVVPKSHGGRTSWDNITTACKKCNHNKGNDARIKPKNMPKKPSYWELAAKRQQFPVMVKDITWGNFLPWEKNLLKLVPVTARIKRYDELASLIC